MSEFKLDFVGVAAPRCGTTWLSACLSEHPDICFSDKKEVHYFDRVKKDERMIADYATHFACMTGQVVGEFTPNYFLDPSTGAALREWFPKVKILVVLRDPVERYFSHVAYDAVRYGRTSETGAVTVSSLHVQAGRYHAHLSRFLAPFTREQVHVILHDEMKQDPERTVRDLYSFLGVDSTFVPTSLHKGINVQSAQNYRVPQLNRVSTIVKCMKRHAIGRALINMVKYAGVGTLWRKISQINRKQPNNVVATSTTYTGSTQERKELVALYKNDITQLAEYIDRDLTSWIHEETQ